MLGGAAALDPGTGLPPGSATARAATVDAGPLRARVPSGRWGLVLFTGRRRLLSEARGGGRGATGRLGFRTADGWWRATRIVRAEASGRTYTAEVATSDPRRRRLLVRVGRKGRAHILLDASVTGGPTADVEAVGLSFAARRGERYLGFGERSNAVDQRGRTVENFVGEGPFLGREYSFVSATIPRWGLHRRRDATYFPMPWLLSTGGYGVLIGNPETSYFRLGSDRPTAWGLEASAPRLELHFLAGPRPADLVRRLTARVGRQPAPLAPWLLGPWFQTGHQNQEPDELDHVRRLRRSDAPVSAVETHMRYMPCGADRGLEQAERARTRAFHRAGLAALTYLREAICAEYQPLFGEGARRGLFTKRRDGSPYVYRAFVGGRVTEVAQIDFSAPGADAFYARLLGRAVSNGYDGWMEDYGEYTPPDSVSANGLDGLRMHNLYPVLYHRSGWRFARSRRRPIVRFQRSGWTGAHPSAQIVWGGDPTTGWGFDGLRSSVVQGLTMGLSGIGIWGSDIGGFFTLSDQRLTPELLARWIEFGAVSGVMRTKAEGIGVAKSARPQIWDRPTLPVWRRYAKLRTQLYPYIAAAVRVYRRTGMPLMRHLALAFPDDRRATAREHEFLFGPHLLAAPVLEPGARRRRLYLPRGRWVDLWRSVVYERRSGGLRLRRARLLRGGRYARLPAPLDELPLLARAGAVLPLLPPDVDTLSSYGRGGGAVRLRDRRRRLGLLAFPRGTSSARMFGRRELLRSAEGVGRWTLRVRGARTRRYGLEASLRTLRRPLRPRTVLLDGRRLPRRAWSYDPGSGALRVTFRARSSRLTVVGARP